MNKYIYAIIIFSILSLVFYFSKFNSISDNDTVFEYNTVIEKTIVNIKIVNSQIKNRNIKYKTVRDFENILSARQAATLAVGSNPVFKNQNFSLDDISKIEMHEIRISKSWAYLVFFAVNTDQKNIGEYPVCVLADGNVIKP
jgi:hypothetical protein